MNTMLKIIKVILILIGTGLWLVGMFLYNVVPTPIPLLDIYAIGFAGMGMLAFVFKSKLFSNKGSDK